MLSVDHDQSDGLFELSHEDFLIEKDEHARKSMHLRSAIEQLSSRQKEILYLKYYQDLSYDEVSEIMNINYQVARNLLHQAIKSMKKLIGHLPLLII